MSALGLAAIVALVAAAVLAGMLRFRRRRPAPRPGPRTVAELVQLRAAAAKPEPGPAAEVQAEVPEASGSTPSEIEPDRPAVSEPIPVAAARRPASPAAERNGRVAWPATADTPWGRARRMIDAEPPAPPMTNGQVSRSAAPTGDSAVPSSAAPAGGSAPIPEPAAGAVGIEAASDRSAGAQSGSTRPPVVAAPGEDVPAAAEDGQSHPASSAAVDSRSDPTADLNRPAPAELQPAAAALHPAPTADLDGPASVGQQPAVAADPRLAPMPDLDDPTPVEPQPTASRPASSVEPDSTVPAERPPAAADPRPARTVDLGGPAPAEPQPAGTADPRPARADAPEQPAETDEQASHRVLRLVPPLPVDSAIPVQRTQAPDSELALLGAFGLVDPAAEPEPALAGVNGRRRRPAGSAGPAQQIRFRVARRDGSVVPGAEVGLLDEDGQHVATGYADADGRGELQAPHPGTYLLVCVAPEHQPGVATVSVADGPGEAALLVARSAVLTGSVRASYTPVVAARLTVVQDGEIVGGTHSDSVGAYRITDLGPGGYGLCVTAPGCLPAAVRIDVADGTELQRDIDLQRAGDVQREVVESTGELPEQATAADRRVVGTR